MSARCTVRVYSREGCCLCDEVVEQLAQLGRRYTFDVRTIDIDGQPDLCARHGERIPVVEVNGREIGAGRIPASVLELHIAHAVDGT